MPMPMPMPQLPLTNSTVASKLRTPAPVVDFSKCPLRRSEPTVQLYGVVVVLLSVMSVLTFHAAKVPNMVATCSVL